MVWIWRWPRESSEFMADFCGFCPQPDVKGLSIFATQPLPPGTKAVLKSRYSLKRFLDLHNPPVNEVTVDRLWRDIILQYVPSDHVQFVPARLTARGGASDDFFVMVPFDRVIGIDKHRSAISDMLETTQGTRIYDIEKLVLVPNCLGRLHLARDKQNVTFLYVSDALRNALAATGQDSPFYTVEQYNREYCNITEH
ncbi:hypothetical protein DK847_20340 [Aestuariivirga litoralis]|uniref:Uncharacterized protein n=1 Tax=Aestuariivirga litoralis TaxID=2650924 RepID=A0A2W2AID4_9HYPH|nr:hypothetical protein [Aestuariivirga litoralis]PZF75041.1 hypothetical protein DK847_20340 [Aestuariivirga litoralis]